MSIRRNAFHNLPWNWASEKEKIDNQGFIAWQCRGQSSNHVLKSSYCHRLRNHILGLLLVAPYSFFDFSQKLKGMHKISQPKLFLVKLSIEWYHIWPCYDNLGPYSDPWKQTLCGQTCTLFQFLWIGVFTTQK